MSKRIGNTSKMPKNSDAKMPNPTELSESECIAHYHKLVEGLVEEAIGNNRRDHLADAFAFGLALLVSDCGIGAAGDALRFIGYHLMSLEERKTLARAGRAKAFEFWRG